jgi:hypothetical protein
MEKRTAYRKGEQWTFGDHMIAEIANGRLADVVQQQVAREVNVTPGTTRVWYAVAVQYPPEKRDPNISWAIYRIALDHPEVIEWAKAEPGLGITAIYARLRGDRPKRQRRARPLAGRPVKFDQDVWLAVGEAYHELEHVGFKVEVQSNGTGVRLVATLEN